jgi:hypothetical protein
VEPSADAKTRLTRIQVWLESLTKNGRIHQLADDFTSEEAESALRVIDRIIRNEDPPERTDARSVVAHLDPIYGHWGQVPIPRDEIPIWEKFFFTPDRALQWTQATLTVEDVPQWHEWESPEKIIAWKTTGIHPHECKAWERSGVEVERAKQWSHSFVGLPIAQSAEWLNAFPDTPVQEVNFLMQTYDSMEEARSWVVQGIPVTQSWQWREKNYAPHQAASMMRRNIAVFDAPYRMPHLVLPGRSWRKVVRLANKNNWELRRVQKGWAEEEHVATFYRSGQQVNFRFRGKAFTEAWGTMDQRSQYILAPSLNLLLQ